MPLELPKMESCRRILVVDDSATNRVLLRAILTHAGFDVEEAENGTLGLEVCRRAPPDLILLDIMMPEMDGIETCRRVREHLSKVELPIIMVTTLAETEGLRSCLGAGANDYVVKPIDRITLLARIDNQLALSGAQRRIEAQALILERALRVQGAMGDMLPEAVLVHDESNRIVYCNRVCHQFCGGEASADLENVFEQLFHGRYAARLRELLSQSRDRPDSTISENLSFSEGPYRDVYLLSRPVVTEEGRFRIWLWRDESATRDLERSMQQRVKLETVGMFAAGVAHNFNNLMGAIVGATEVLERVTAENQKARRCIELIKKSVDSGASLTRKMTAVGPQRIEVTKKCTDVIHPIEELLACYRLSTGARITFDLQFDANLAPAAINELALLEILGNIVSNAAESISGTGSVKVEVRNADRGMLEFIVADTGSGMDDVAKAKLLEPFFSTKAYDKLTNVSVEGRGLGMWNAYNLLLANGGTLHIQSALGKGTTVAVKLPAVAASSSDPAGHEHHRQQSQGS